MPLDEELRRVLPVIETLAPEINVPISIDTYKAAVAGAAVAAGASIVNDISGLGYDPKLGDVVARTGAGVVLMHTRGRSRDMYREAGYGDAEIDALGEAVKSAPQERAALWSVRKAVSFGAEQGLHVAFFGVDSTRADLAFFERAYKTARDAGAQEFAIVDTIAATEPRVHVLHRAQKEGIGPAYRAGFQRALELGLGPIPCDPFLGRHGEPLPGRHLLRRA